MVIFAGPLLRALKASSQLFALFNKLEQKAGPEDPIESQEMALPIILNRTALGSLDDVGGGIGWRPRRE